MTVAKKLFLERELLKFVKLLKKTEVPSFRSDILKLVHSFLFFQSYCVRKKLFLENNVFLVGLTFQCIRIFLSHCWT